MKKLLSTVLAVMMIFTCAAAMADDFTLHSSVMFDMTVDQMIEAETAKGYSPVEVDNAMALGVSGTEEYNFGEYSAVYDVPGSFVSDSMNHLYYFFDENGLLCQMIYTCSSSYKALTYVEEITESMVSLYTDKYGAPEATVITADGIRDAQHIMSLHVPDSFWNYIYSNAGTTVQWMIPYGDDMIADIVIQPVKQDMSKLDMVAYSFIIGYTRLTGEQYRNAVAEQLQNETDAVNQFFDDI